MEEIKELKQRSQALFREIQKLQEKVNDTQEEKVRETLLKQLKDVQWQQLFYVEKIWNLENEKGKKENT